MRVLDRSTRWQAALVASTFVLAVSTAAIPFLNRHAPHAQASGSPAAWPRSEGRLFDMSSKDAWRRVQDRLKELGLAVEKADGKNRLLLTRWAHFGDSRLQWLARPKLRGEYAAEQVRFEVFVSPFVEPARLYVGSVTQLRLMTGRVSKAILYNDPTVNTALLRQLAQALGQDGFPIPASQEERQKLAASMLKGKPDECARRIESCRVSSSRLDKPEKLALSEFEVVFPEQAARERVEAPVVVQLDVSEDGAVVGGQVLGSRRGHQLEVSAAGATSLLVFSPLRLCGCPAPHTTVYTIDYRLR
jgi:hypothetical protein